MNNYCEICFKADGTHQDWCPKKTLEDKETVDKFKDLFGMKEGDVEETFKKVGSDFESLIIER